MIPILPVSFLGVATECGSLFSSCLQPSSFLARKGSDVNSTKLFPILCNIRGWNLLSPNFHCHQLINALIQSSTCTLMLNVKYVLDCFVISGTQLQAQDQAPTTVHELSQNLCIQRLHGRLFQEKKSFGYSRTGDKQKNIQST